MQHQQCNAQCVITLTIKNLLISPTWGWILYRFTKSTYVNLVAVRSIPIRSIRKLRIVGDFSLGFGVFISCVTHGPSSIVWRHVTVSWERVWMASFIRVQPIHTVFGKVTLLLPILAVKPDWILNIFTWRQVYMENQNEKRFQKFTSSRVFWYRVLGTLSSQNGDSLKVNSSSLLFQLTFFVKCRRNLLESRESKRKKILLLLVSILHKTFTS